MKTHARKDLSQGLQPALATLCGAYDPGESTEGRVIRPSDRIVEAAYLDKRAMVDCASCIEALNKRRAEINLHYGDRS